MDKFSAHAFFDIASKLQAIAAFQLPEVQNIKIGQHNKLITNYLPNLRKSCEPVGLRFTCKHIDWLLTVLPSGAYTIKDFQEMIPELQRRIKDEMESELFLHVPTSRADVFEKTNLFGEKVNKAFPSASYDIEESGKSFAVGRWTGCVFHLMRVMEVGLRIFGLRLMIHL